MKWDIVKWLLLLAAVIVGGTTFCGVLIKQECDERERAQRERDDERESDEHSQPPRVP